MPELEFRFATVADVVPIATLHASSWRSAYTDALSPNYLKHHAERDRLNLWQQRLTNSAGNQRVILLEQSGSLLGFACLFIDADPLWGTLLDNLHVTTDKRRTGLGTKLMSEVSRVIAEYAPARPVHLWVVKTNLRAQRFYQTLGARCEEEDIWNAPDGGQVPVYRFTWPCPSAIANSISSES